MVTTTSPTSPSATGSPVPGRTISTITSSSSDQAFARRRLVGDHAQIGGGIGLIGGDAARREHLRTAAAGRPRRTPAPCSATTRRRRSSSAFSSMMLAGSTACRHSQPAAGRPSPAPAFRSARRRPGRPGSPGAAHRLDHEAGRRHVVGEAVVHQVAGAEAGRIHGPAERQQSSPQPFRIVDRAGR